MNEDGAIDEELDQIGTFFWGLLVKILEIIFDIGVTLFWDPFWDLTWGGVPLMRVDYRKW